MKTILSRTKKGTEIILNESNGIKIITCKNNIGKEVELTEKQRCLLMELDKGKMQNVGEDCEFLVQNGLACWFLISNDIRILI